MPDPINPLITKEPVAHVVPTETPDDVPELKPSNSTGGVKSAKKSLKRFGKKLLLRSAQATGGTVIVGTLPISWPLVLLGRAVDHAGPANAMDATMSLVRVRNDEWENKAFAVGSFGAFLLYKAATDELKLMKKTK